MGGDRHPAPISPQDSGTFLGWVSDVVRQARLAWRLFWDRRVPFWDKLIPPATLAYLIFPLDFDFAIPGLGYLDDVVVLLLGIKLFIELAPPDVVREHLIALGARIKEWRVVEEERGAEVLEGDYEVKEIGVLEADAETDVEEAEIVEGVEEDEGVGVV